MKLTISTPLAVALEADDLIHVRAEDRTGAFGVLPGHADFLTVLDTSVVSFRDRRDPDQEHHVAVRGGVFEVRYGNMIAIATREAVVSDDLQRLETEVLTRFQREREQEQAARTDAQRLYFAALQRIIRYLRPGGRTGSTGVVPYTSEKTLTP